MYTQRMINGFISDWECQRHRTHCGKYRELQRGDCNDCKKENTIDRKRGLDQKRNEQAPLIVKFCDLT